MLGTDLQINIAELSLHAARDVFANTLYLIGKARLLHDLHELIENYSRTNCCPDVRSTNEKRLNVH